jgi:hypothetical protein
MSRTFPSSFRLIIRRRTIQTSSNKRDLIGEGDFNLQRFPYF